MNTPDNLKHQKLFQYLSKSLDNSGNIWILKPTDYNRGRGISVFNDLTELRKTLKGHLQAMTASPYNYRSNTVGPSQKASYNPSEFTTTTKPQKPPPLSKIYNPNAHLSSQDRSPPNQNADASNNIPKEAVIKSGT